MIFLRCQNPKTEQINIEYYQKFAKMTTHAVWNNAAEASTFISVYILLNVGGLAAIIQKSCWSFWKPVPNIRPVFGFLSVECYEYRLPKGPAGLLGRCPQVHRCSIVCIH